MQQMFHLRHTNIVLHGLYTWRLETEYGVVHETTEQFDVVPSLTADFYRIQHSRQAALLCVYDVDESTDNRNIQLSNHLLE